MKTLLILCTLLTLGCSDYTPNRCEGPHVTVTFDSSGNCSYKVSALTQCDYSEVRSLIDLGQDTCMNAGYECEVTAWTATPSEWDTIVEGSCKSE